MTNSDNGGQLAAEILRTSAHDNHWPDFAPREIRNEKDIMVSADMLARYTGVNGIGPGFYMTITAMDGQLISQMSRQKQAFLDRAIRDRLRTKAVDAQIKFPKGENSPSSQLTLHQGGRDTPAKRLSDAEAKTVADAAADFDKRFKSQTAASGSEAAVRIMIEGLRTGKPDYDRMSPGLANVTRQQLSGLQPVVVGMGALQSLTFKGVGPGGADIYQVKFEKGSLDYRIWLTPDGKVESANFRPIE